MGKCNSDPCPRYGRPDPLLQRECDMRVTLRMASVQYVHTQRFQAEVVAFIQHFTQLQDVLGRQRAAIEGQTVCLGLSSIFLSLFFFAIEMQYIIYVNASAQVN